jgi:hypothetical protein
MPLEIRLFFVRGIVERHHLRDKLNLIYDSLKWLGELFSKARKERGMTYLHEDIVAMFALCRGLSDDGTRPLLVNKAFSLVFLHCETLVMLSCDSFRFDSLEITRSVEYEDMTKKGPTRKRNENFLGCKTYNCVRIELRTKMKFRDQKFVSDKK